MGYDKHTLQLFNGEEISDDRSLLVLGFDESLAKTLPKHTAFVEPNISQTKYASAKFNDKSFFTKDLASFSLEKKFHNILSLNKLQYSKNLTETFLAIERHLLEDAYLYFPLSCNETIKTYLIDNIEEDEPFKDASFTCRSRQDVEDAVMTAPFDSIQISEKIEHLDFYSIDSLKQYLEKELLALCPVVKESLNEHVNELAIKLYGNQSNDEVLSLSSPWILLSLSN